MQNYEIVNSDNFNQSNFTENFSDLINNNTYFNSIYDEAKLICLDNYKDNSNYISYPSLEDIIKNYDHTTDKDKTFVCTVEDKQIWTSDFSKGGYDRLTKVSDQTCRENLNQKIYGSDEPKGFDDNDAGTLNGVLRYLKDETGKIFLVLVKNMGNHRFWMKKLANRGKKINLLFKIKFHDLDKNLNKDDFITIESDAHHSDADDRQSQNETQKFMSGFRAKRKELIDCFNYLKTIELEYEGIMQLEKVENANNWPSLTSIMGFNKGQGNGIFKKFGDTNVNAAIGTAKEIVKITKENLIHNSAIWCLASMFKSLTEIYGDSKSSYSLFTKKELRDFFIEYFKENNRQSKFRRKSLTLSDLVQTQGIKDYNFINCDVFWRDGAIVQYFLQLKDRKTGFTYNHPCMQHLLGQITPILRKTAMSLVSA